MRRLPDINADTITQAVIARHAQAGDARLREVMTSLVQHLHAFAREVRLSEPEWQAGLRFLAEAGQRSGGHAPEQQELALLSDTLGLSMLVAAIGQPHARGCTEATLKQPLQRESGPLLERGAWLMPARQGAALFVRGQVRGQVQGLGAAPIAGAELSVWQGARAARFVCDEQGRYHFGTELAEPQQIPHEGPVGQLLAALGRDAWRPAHLHFQISAPGHRSLVTHVFRDGSPHLDGDATFAVRRSLVARWQEHPPGCAPDGTLQRDAFFTLDFDFLLQADDEATAAPSEPDPHTTRRQT